MDAEVIADPGSGWIAKSLSTASLVLNAYSGGVLPNFGGLMRGGKRIVAGLEKVGDIAPDMQRLGDIMEIKGNRAINAAQDGAKEIGKAAPEGNGVGAYTIEFESGTKYHGKGPEKRMNESAKGQSNVHDDPVVSKSHTPTENNREALKEEARRIAADGGPGVGNYNKINSPGRKMLEEDGPQ